MAPFLSRNFAQDYSNLRCLSILSDDEAGYGLVSGASRLTGIQRIQKRQDHVFETFNGIEWFKTLVRYIKCGARNHSSQWPPSCLLDTFLRQHKACTNNTPRLSSFSSSYSNSTTYQRWKKLYHKSSFILLSVIYCPKTAPTIHQRTACTEGFTSCFGFPSLQSEFGTVDFCYDHPMKLGYIADILENP